MRRPGANILAGPGAPAGAVGALLALQLAAAGLLGSATRESVFFAGRALDWGCAFRDRFGFACPNCGMTRSVLLSLHGRVGEALSVNPAGPVLVLGVALFSAAMFYLMLYERRHAGTAAAARVRRAITRGALAYAALLMAVWLGHWLSVIS